MTTHSFLLSHRSSLLALVFVALSGCVSCGAMTRKIASDATPVAVDSGMEAATSPENQRQLVNAIDPEIVEEATYKTVSGSSDGLIAALGEEARQDQLAAAMRPLVASMVDTSVKSALNDSNLVRIRELAKQATLGFQDAIDEVEKQKTEGTIPDDEGNVLEAANDVAEGGDVILYVLGALAAVLALLLAVGTWWALRKKRNYDAESARRDREIAQISQMLASEGLGYDDSSLKDAPDSQDGDDSAHDEEMLRQAMRRVAERKSTTGDARVSKQ